MSLYRFRNTKRKSLFHFRNIPSDSIFRTIMNKMLGKYVVINEGIPFNLMDGSYYVEKE